MEFWKALWQLVWFVGMGIFVVLSVIVVIEGGKELKALLGWFQDGQAGSEGREG